MLLAVRNEPVEVVRQTISSALETDYPADRLSVIVVDNSDDAEHVQVVESMLATLGDGTVKFIHRDGTQGYKPYNLDLAMKQIDSDYVFLLDADSTLTFDALKASGATLDTDPELGMAQLITISTNGSVGVFARASALFVSMLRTSIGMLNDSGGFLFFYGHNGMWRTAALREVGPWEQYYRGRIMIGEDRMLSLLAYAAGYRGATVDRLAGEWAPMTINEFRSTYQRWCYAFCQSLSRDGLRLMTSAGASGLAKFDELQRELNIFACALVPLFPITALVSRGSIIETFYLGTFLLFEIAGSLAVYFRFARGGHSAKKFRQACGAGFLVASYGSWISAVSAIRFALGLPQGWTPTSKSADDSSGLRATFASHKVMTAYSVLVLALTACVYVVRARDGELDGAEALDLGLGAAFALSLMLFLVVYGRDRSAPVPNSEMMTINRVQSPFE